MLSAPARAQLTITRSPAQKPACKDPSRNDQARVITSEAAYTPTSKRAGSRSQGGNICDFTRNLRKSTAQDRILG
ncbi:alpha-galactosidase [Lacticaseibacillus rhamnosus]|nr:alpha-galactosidase [Lacticaseibacillus rhamnosus]AXI95900.1 alpha-galactosidase [Lacticaseibacillus rhamnosus GG]ART97328.1 alpha-galactosidase [Lacticaseibacillus rhamnosus]AZZ24572.1 alpha-galactosidase [Lacticaseibacillus rhamnosus]MBM6440746.1 alpha-galactosidase [Lacticaseibacillus rhamnosus]